jgi:hypothetical protein
MSSAIGLVGSQYTGPLEFNWVSMAIGFQLGTGLDHLGGGRLVVVAGVVGGARLVAARLRLRRLQCNS